ncbi:Ort1p Ecym_4629 [Eremothecium cymbalariae DBVPG|uniref:Mitochondrial ornithine carrier protein n=1 Tax=Eremothecium cymbalariae (strain CBS 270.75 / DBVPG 7215 / KCTC 17166 / NRRL Y-17582) TaxID=931890 RepID=G8JSD2_ERECY|nr:hypothetical protein Ecym_4629 [Eremothecium cymbalariae DBVPG\
MDPERSPNAYHDILSGGIAGAVGKVVEYPFDTVKVRLQTQPVHVFPSALSCIRYTYKNEGVWRGFYQGLGSPLVGAFLENAVLFVSFNKAIQAIDTTNIEYGSTTKVALAGAFAGAWASFVLTPVELVKCKLQVSNLRKDSKSYDAIWSTIKSVIRQNGLQGMWRGQSSTFIRETVGGAVWFTTYETLKNWFASTREDGRVPTQGLLVSGASAGVSFNACVFPVDTIKSVMQTEHIGLSPAVLLVLKKYGAKGFYRGIGITLIRAMPANAVVFYTYEHLSSSR